MQNHFTLSLDECFQWQEFCMYNTRLYYRLDKHCRLYLGLILMHETKEKYVNTAKEGFHVKESPTFTDSLPDIQPSLLDLATKTTSLCNILQVWPSLIFCPPNFLQRRTSFWHKWSMKSWQSRPPSEDTCYDTGNSRKRWLLNSRPWGYTVAWLSPAGCQTSIWRPRGILNYFKLFEMISEPSFYLTITLLLIAVIFFHLPQKGLTKLP